MAYNGREGFNYFYKNTCGAVKESIRSPNFGNFSERKDLSIINKDSVRTRPLFPGCDSRKLNNYNTVN
jgi:hypothetical protein